MIQHPTSSPHRRLSRPHTVLDFAWMSLLLAVLPLLLLLLLLWLFLLMLLLLLLMLLRACMYFLRAVVYVRPIPSPPFPYPSPSPPFSAYWACSYLVRRRNYCNAFHHRDGTQQCGRGCRFQLCHPQQSIMLCRTASAFDMLRGTCLCGCEIIFTCPGRWKGTGERHVGLRSFRSTPSSGLVVIRRFHCKAISFNVCLFLCTVREHWPLDLTAPHISLFLSLSHSLFLSILTVNRSIFVILPHPCARGAGGFTQKGGLTRARSSGLWPDASSEHERG